MYLHHVSICINRFGVCVGSTIHVAVAPRNKACLRSIGMCRVPFGLQLSPLSRWIPGTRKNTSYSRSWTHTCRNTFMVQAPLSLCHLFLPGVHTPCQTMFRSTSCALAGQRITIHPCNVCTRPASGRNKGRKPARGLRRHVKNTSRKATLNYVYIGNRHHSPWWHTKVKGDWSFSFRSSCNETTKDQAGLY